MTQQLPRPGSVLCTADGRYLALYFHPLRFRCQCYISNVLALASLLAPPWMACAQDGFFCGLRMDHGEIITVTKNAYLDHGQQTLQWCPDVGYPMTAAVEQQSLRPIDCPVSRGIRM